MYRHYSKIFNFNIYSQKLYPGDKFNIDKIKKAVKKFKIDTIVLVNPSHPIENFYDKKSLLKILNFCKKNKIFLIIDEVYNFEKTIYKKYLSYKNVIFVRSFSKVYGLPGLRLGYAVGNVDTIKFIENYRLAIEVGSNTVNFFNNYKTVTSIILKNQNRIKKAIKFARNNFKKRNIYCYNQRVNSITFDCLNFKRREKIHKYLQISNIYALKLNGNKLNRFLNITSTNIQNLKFFFKKLDKFKL